MTKLMVVFEDRNEVTSRCTTCGRPMLNFVQKWDISPVFCNCEKSESTPVPEGAVHVVGEQREG